MGAIDTEALGRKTGALGLGLRSYRVNIRLLYEETEGKAAAKRAKQERKEDRVRVCVKEGFFKRKLGGKD